MFRTNVQNRSFDVAILGAGMAGMATALRLHAAGRSTIVLEAHGHAGGCAGYFRHRGFSFDVGATTLVDFEPGGVGGEFIDTVGLGTYRHGETRVNVASGAAVARRTPPGRESRSQRPRDRLGSMVSACRVTWRGCPIA